MEINFVASFEKIIQKLFDTMGYSTFPNKRNKTADRVIDIDLEAQLDDEKKLVEIKFYRSREISSISLHLVAERFAYNIKSFKDGSGLLIISAVISNRLKTDILEKYGIEVWDRSTLYALMTEYSPVLRDQFEQLLMAAQQGDQPYDVFAALDDIHIAHSAIINFEPEDVKYSPPRKGIQLRTALQAIPSGKKGWSQYENTCKEILEYLFNEDLTLWDKQVRTEDGLSRFDLICRIASKDDYWKSLISSFNTRFILFEFKNYAQPVSQDQVYTTERYLYTKGLRSVGFIIAANGASNQAESAARGALKENGKLIMFLSNEDLFHLLILKDDLGNCNDYLSNKLDKWLIDLSR